MNYNKSISYNHKKALHFRQWSNKSYAAFCSMGKVVHIGILSTAISQWIGMVVDHVEEIIASCLIQEKDKSNDGIEEEELLQLIPVLVNPTIACGTIDAINNSTRYASR
jgi:hypothetical protein